ncbi:hypothetical protein F8S13_04080 [Chloroflexia bacterium SDU3-3]|nr:hypothetical protein F8S13_04080 [Chloroflexia bacterium SDU3-3]
MSLDRVKMSLDRVKMSLDRVKTNLDRVKMNLDRVKMNLDRVKMSLDRVKMNLDRVKMNLDQVRLAWRLLPSVMAVVARCMFSFPWRLGALVVNGPLEPSHPRAFMVFALLAQSGASAYTCGSSTG